MAIQLTLRLLGRKVEAINMCRKARERATLALPWRREWYRRLLLSNGVNAVFHGRERAIAFAVWDGAVSATSTPLV